MAPFILNLKDYTYPPSTFDLVTSRLALHYIEHLTIIFQNVYETLKTNGTFTFSVQHPIITSSFESLQTSGKRTSWLVDDYFKLGKRVEPWIDQEVIKYHRTTEEYFTLLQQAGFTITNLKEATPDQTYFQSAEEYERRLRIPSFSYSLAENKKTMISSSSFFISLHEQLLYVHVFLFHAEYKVASQITDPY